MSESTNVRCDDGKNRRLHGVAGSYFVYANGRRVYGYVHNIGDLGAVFHASANAKYRHLVSAPALAEVS